MCHWTAYSYDEFRLDRTNGATIEADGGQGPHYDLYGYTEKHFLNADAAKSTNPIAYTAITSKKYEPSFNGMCFSFWYSLVNETGIESVTISTITQGPVPFSTPIWYEC